MKRDFRFYIKLFISCFELSAFTFGGGYVMISLMRKKFVEKLGWLNEEEMLDFTVIAQSSPGAIAINTTLLLGFRLAGIPGAIITVFATVLPPFLIIYALSFGYSALQYNAVFQGVMRGMQAGVAAVITDVVIGMAKSVLKNRAKAVISLVLMIGAFAAVSLFSVNPMLVIAFAAVSGLLLFRDESGEKEDRK
ncbi:MAG: chromate transporter [Eubacteriales bacterium]|nr:chromate transporter [Eubacteriales bacterium]MDD4422472.1 chromate transporter [Eubacteriales bacterium]